MEGGGGGGGGEGAAALPRPSARPGSRPLAYNIRADKCAPAHAGRNQSRDALVFVSARLGPGSSEGSRRLLLAGRPEASRCTSLNLNIQVCKTG